jgi:hypothetical protein
MFDETTKHIPDPCPVQFARRTATPIDAGSPAAPSPPTSPDGAEVEFSFSADTTFFAMENTGARAEVVLDGTEAEGGNPVDENTEKLGT